MKRLFVLALSVTSLSLLFGAVAHAAPEGDVDHIRINTGSLQNLGCRDTDALMSFSFTATGSGRGVVTVIAENGETVGKTPVDIIPGQTPVEVRLANGYAGLASIIVEADNHKVPDGQKGPQGAYQQTAPIEVGSAACADYAQSVAAQESHEGRSWWQTSLLVILVVFATIGFCIAVRRLFRGTS